MKYCIILTVLSTLLLSLTGCWSNNELNRLALVAAIGIDKKDDKFLLSVQIINPGVVAPKMGGGGAYAPVSMFKETGTTVMEGFRRVTRKMPRQIYFAHLRFLIISEEVARGGVQEVLDFFSREHEFRDDFYIIITKKNRAEQVRLPSSLVALSLKM